MNLSVLLKSNSITRTLIFFYFIFKDYNLLKTALAIKAIAREEEINGPFLERLAWAVKDNSFFSELILTDENEALRKVDDLKTILEKYKGASPFKSETIRIIETAKKISNKENLYLFAVSHLTKKFFLNEWLTAYFLRRLLA